MASSAFKRFVGEINGKWLIVFLFCVTMFLTRNYHDEGKRRDEDYVESPKYKRIYEWENFQESQREFLKKTVSLEKPSNLTTATTRSDTAERLLNENKKNLGEKKPPKAETDQTLNKLPECSIDLCPKRFPPREKHPVRINIDKLPSIEYIAHGADTIICSTYKKLPSKDSRQFCNELENFQKEYNLTSIWSLSRDDRFRISSSILNNMGYEQRVPNVIGLGIKKCGSSAMLKLLGMHPRIYCVAGEGSFFGLEDRYPKGLDFYRYRSLFSKEGAITFEKTPHYFEKSDIVPQQMKESLPDSTKFYFSVRDPVERTISDFHHTRVVELLKAVNKTGFTPESEGELFLERLFDESGNIRSDHKIVDVSYYARHFKMYLEHFPRDRFHIEDAADIRDKPMDVLQRMEKFLGIESFFENDMLVDSPSSEFGTCLHIRGEDECTRFFGTKHPKPYVSETILKQLRDHFRPLNEEFEEITGQKFAWTHL